MDPRYLSWCLKFCQPIGTPAFQMLPLDPASHSSISSWSMFLATTHLELSMMPLQVSINQLTRQMYSSQRDQKDKMLRVKLWFKLKVYFLFSDGLEAQSTKPFLGYLCETRAIYTQTGNDMCWFPFSFQGKTYTSCSFENNTLLNNSGLPWCATEVLYALCLLVISFLISQTLPKHYNSTVVENIMIMLPS